MNDSRTSETEPLSLRAYSKHRGVSLPAVQKAIRSGRITTRPDGKVDPEQADADWERNTTPRTDRSGLRTKTVPRSYWPAVGSQQPQSEPLLGNLTSFATARSVREQYLARLTKIQFEKETGKLVGRDEVQVAAFNKFRTFRDGMLNIPDRVSAQIASETDAGKVHQILTAEIRKALLEFANG